MSEKDALTTKKKESPTKTATKTTAKSAEKVTTPRFTFHPPLSNRILTASGWDTHADLPTPAKKKAVIKK